MSRTHGKLVVCMLALFLVGCVKGPSMADIERSKREYELANALRDEGKAPAALAHLRNALEIDPENAEAHLLLGYIKLERKDFHNADAHLSQGLELLLEQERFGAILAEARNMHGIVLLHLNRYEEGVESLRQSATDEYNTAPHLAWGNLGFAYFVHKDYAKAVEALQEATHIQARFCVGFFNLGRSYFALEQLEDAEKALTQSLEADPECRESPLLQGAWRIRGEVRARLGFPGEARGDFERCVELGPESQDGAFCTRMLER